MKEKIHLTFTNNNKSYSFCSIIEKKNGELIIIPRFAEFVTNKEFGFPEIERQIKNQHYTIHNSPNSKLNSVLNHTIEYIDGNKDNTKTFTKAFKINNLFCPIYFCRNIDFILPKYLLKENENKIKNLRLGEFNPKQKTLYYMVVVSNNNKDLRTSKHNLVTIKSKKYSVHVIWSFGIIPSHSTGAKIHFGTLPEIESKNKEGSLTIFALSSNVALVHCNNQVMNNELKPHWSSSNSFFAKIVKEPFYY